MANPDKLSDSGILLLIALLIGIAVSIGERMVFAVALNRSIDLSEVDVLLLKSVLVAAPFLALALCSTFHLLSWAITLAVTLALYGWFLSVGVAYQRAPDGSGANIGLGLIMLFSPAPITGLALVTNRAMSWRRQS